MFSKRTQWNLTKNALTLLLEQKRESVIPILDLTVSNPTQCEIQYPEAEILTAFQNPSNLLYVPQPRGLLSARMSIVEYYSQNSIEVHPDNLFLSASTSEGYSFLFRLLCNAGDGIMIPQPSYPLFQLLADINDVELQPYQLEYKDGWVLDFASIENVISHRTRAIILVNPNNPTGSFIKKKEYPQLVKICQKHNIAIISDEVFSDYIYKSDSNNMISLAGSCDVLTFVLNGISKMLALPQMKLAWILVNGFPSQVHKAIERLEMVTDTYLSVGTPIQHALPELMKHREFIQNTILSRVKENVDYAGKLLKDTSINPLKTEGGWYLVLKIPLKLDEEKLVLDLLEKQNTFVHPGYFFDFPPNGYLVLSLLTPEQVFQKGLENIITMIQ